MNLAVIAAGAWGTALAIAFSARHRVTLWTREEDVTQSMLAERENKHFFPGHRFPDALRIGTDFTASVADADLLILATPLIGFRDTLRHLAETRQVKPLIWVCKGMEAGSAKLPHQVVEEELGREVLCGALTGPSFAEEVARGLPTAITLASRNAEFARRTALELHSSRLRIYANDDLSGAEVGGAVKNVMAIATGICDGLGLGHNARAALMTRGLAEIARLGVALGGQPNTFMGLAGMGDLLLTCTGDLSRNRQVGLALAAGRKLPQILADLGHVAEGVSTAREVLRLAGQIGIDMPITQAVDAILHHDVPAAEAVEQLLSRDPRPEIE
ncbi:NAD(P)H-dependent glycerol-3-phosphate dehydrogenase [Propionivibrio sp.]|uniref:NAD(P)H-dependent glycerol-3-phosphate dehydrogenase n=1 Tax=Propionivibrio sp. TaxID=2212460 RepID=UPI0025D652F4|nr:NAD(P)H-dependent glycerol-3-phosphate dehydrogenase [Propionivibrio sp.]MBK7355364.1 NAD(P)-dependent glycerol-3-phosphate dehydrogenase [Propionivibrio sp.]MBK8399760.1 NAD(P)-dependent glycerol-3-phosphate dehydrogenase [Propionivibrio sp.]MBK8743344.1 NAD(P)-dependent glycerol-3-phosphate dehydrogenase [Propionivibrio sp.]MBK8894632.1 NAD(P)-dependent glycerol-3-phosphate dehydrogenase [Propionivibrio sp.]MBL0207115.1 NAD(P)-dependent glycerol-3-phosphate dehydrogenase [Propionivibrio s